MRRAAKRAFEGIIVNVKTVREGMKFPFPRKGFCRFGHWREKLRSFSRIVETSMARNHLREALEPGDHLEAHSKTSAS